MSFVVMVTAKVTYVLFVEKFQYTLPEICLKFHYSFKKNIQTFTAYSLLMNLIQNNNAWFS